jgi:hypothetical protein
MTGSTTRRMRLSSGHARVPTCLCRVCGIDLDAVSEISREDDGKPVVASPGDITVCINCGTVSVMDDNLRLREPTLEETEGLRKDERVVAAIAAIKLRNVIGKKGLAQ